MHNLTDCKEIIHSCSKCGLCQAVCPVYKFTGNDCSVSRGQFIMLKGIIDGKLKMSKTINKYLDMCLKCGACSRFCPSDIDTVSIISLAKSEYFKFSGSAKIFSFLEKKLLFDICLNVAGLFSKKTKSKKFTKKILYFGGCKAKLAGNKSVVNLLNNLDIEVITPDFKCCGISFLLRGDLNTFIKYIEDFSQKLEKYGIDEIVTSCASCEKMLKSYSKWHNVPDYKVKNIFEYLCESKQEFELKKKCKVTFHKPCNFDNYDSLKNLFFSTKNLEYSEMSDFDECCGYNGLKNFNTLFKLIQKKRNNILNTKADYVLTNCSACEAILRLTAFKQAKVLDVADFYLNMLKI